MTKSSSQLLEDQERTTKSVIDLRSDTVTRPTAAMRKAMAEAEVGDDVYGEDPTVNRLEASAARIFQREAALFVPTGTMGNQIAIKVHTRPGQEIICEERAHILDWEMGMPALFSGCILRTLRGDDGILTWSEIRKKIPAYSYARAQTGLIEIENTHNMAGGTVTPLEVMEEVCDAAHERGIPVHLDGARIFNAAVALKLPVADVTRKVDSVSPEKTKTNIVIFDVSGTGMTSDQFLHRLREQNVIGSTVNDLTVRLLTHMDVTQADCEQAAEIIRKVCEN
jgi:threonine aldolase